jgi:hypothetical protein
MKSEITKYSGITAIALSEELLAKISQSGDLSYLSEHDRLVYYFAYARQLGLNPVSRPFDYIEEKGSDGKTKISLYPNSCAASQLRDSRGVSTRILKEELMLDGEIYSVLVEARIGDRIEQASGKVPIKTDHYGKPLSSKAKATAMKKAETQARRRATLAIVGLNASDDEDRKAPISDMPQDVWDAELSDALQAIASSEPKAIAPSNKSAFVDQLQTLGINAQGNGAKIKSALKSLGINNSTDIPLEQISTIANQVAEILNF